MKRASKKPKATGDQPKELVEKSVDQVKFNAPLGSNERYAQIAARWKYEQFAPFMRKLLDAAEKGDPETGIIQFFRGSDSLRSAA